MLPSRVAVLCAAAILAQLDLPAAESIVSQRADLTIVHLTDLHVSSDTTAKRDIPWTHKIVLDGYKLHRKCLPKTLSLLEQAVCAINTRICPDVVVITGDIIDCSSDEDALSKAADLIGRINCPVITVEGEREHGLPQATFEKRFGPREGSAVPGNYHFFWVPHDADTAALARLDRSLSVSDRSRLRILCMHRMLRAPLPMRILSRIYTPTILSPQSEAILQILKRNGGEFLVLCGHSHTNWEKRDGKLLHVCTASLAESPHELRILKITKHRIETRVVRLSELQGVESPVSAP